MIAEDAGFTVAAKWQRTPVIAELLLRPAGPSLRHRGAYRGVLHRAAAMESAGLAASPRQRRRR